MRKLALGLAVLIVLFGAERASAQTCLSFSKDVPCVRGGQINRLDFGAPRPANDHRPAKPLVIPFAEHQPDAIDCAMVKPVDPSFRSTMPVVRPDPRTNYPTPIVKVPSCKSS
jgi:hypothetical protein